MKKEGLKKRFSKGSKKVLVREMAMILCILLFANVLPGVVLAEDSVTAVISQVGKQDVKGLATKADAWSLSLKNATAKTINVRLTCEQIAVDGPNKSNAKIEYAQDVKYEVGDSVWVTLAAGASMESVVRFYYSNPIGTPSSNCTVHLESVEVKDFTDFSTDEKNPTTISSGNHIIAPTTGTRHYYTFTLANAATVSGHMTGPISIVDLNFKEGASKVHNTVSGGSYEFTWKLKPDTYILMITTSAQSTFDGSFYEFDLNIVDYQWPTVNMSWKNSSPAGSNEKIPFTAELTNNGSSTTKLRSWVADTDSEGASLSFGGGSSASDNIAAGTKPGWYTLTVMLEDYDYGYYNQTFEYSILPGIPSITSVTSDNKSISIIYYGNRASGEYKMLQQYVGNKWETVKTVKSKENVSNKIQLTGLKASSTYKLRLVGFNEKTSKHPELIGEPSKTYTIKTGVNTKPVVSSAKAFDAKLKVEPKKYHAGYYDGANLWHDPYYSGGYTYTVYKVKVTLKKAIKGTVGLEINDVKVKGKGKTFTKTISAMGKRIGKTFKIRVRGYGNASYGAFTPYASAKKVKIKK